MQLDETDKNSQIELAPFSFSIIAFNKADCAPSSVHIRLCVHTHIMWHYINQVEQVPRFLIH